MAFPAYLAQAAVGRQLGDDVDLRVGGESYVVRGVFDAASRKQLGDGSGWIDTAPRITFATSEVGDLEIAEGDEVDVGSATYVVAEPPRPDGIASVVVILREAA